MKLETKQNEVRLVAESEIDKFYLENFFTEKSRPWVTKEEDFVGDIFAVHIGYDKPE